MCLGVARAFGAGGRTWIDARVSVVRASFPALPCGESSVRAIREMLRSREEEDEDEPADGAERVRHHHRGHEGRGF